MFVPDEGKVQQLTAKVLLREHKERFAPDPTVVEQCHKLLQAAKSGELRGFAYATVMHDDLCEAGKTGCGFVLGGSGVMFALSHALQRLRRHWANYCDED
jgi:hypothetical protein